MSCGAAFATSTAPAPAAPEQPPEERRRITAQSAEFWLHVT
jgi:hypothetical protein